MVIDMLVHPLLYGDIYKPGDGPDGFAFWEREYGMGHMGPMDWEEIEVELNAGDVQLSALMPIDASTASGGCFATNEQIAQIVAAHPDRFIGFASVDLHCPDAAERLERAFRDLGARGLSLHPAKQGFAPDDPLAEPLYELCETYNRPVVFHAGMSWEPKAPLAQSHPLAFERTIMDHPNVRFGLTHFGWPWVRETVAMLLKYPNCYADTSITYLDSPEEMMSRLFTIDMGEHWFERSFSHQVMFASNTPRFRAFKLKRALDAVPMPDDVRELLYSGNALRFLDGEE